MLLRLANGRRPVADPPATALEAFRREIVQDYDTWLRDLRGLHPETCAKRTAQALRFLASLDSGWSCKIRACRLLACR
jgi:integrase/recombinase XerD